MATRRTNQENHAPLINWNEIKGKMRVWGREIEVKKVPHMLYSTSVGKKNADDEYVNLYFNVAFKKEEHPDIEGAFIINVKKGYLTVSCDKSGNTYPAVMVLDYDVIED